MRYKEYIYGMYIKCVNGVQAMRHLMKVSLEREPIDPTYYIE